jgi:hypothetical protein
MNTLDFISERYIQIEPKNDDYDINGNCIKHRFFYENLHEQYEILIMPQFLDDSWLFTIKQIKDEMKCDNEPIALCICKNGNPVKIKCRHTNKSKKFLYILNKLTFFYEQNSWKKILIGNIPCEMCVSLI